jgi:hypothetical protein
VDFYSKSFSMLAGLVHPCSAEHQDGEGALSRHLPVSQGLSPR